MKKFFLGLLLFIGFYFIPSYAQASSTILFNDLNKEEQEHFLSKGFNNTNQYFRETITQYPDSNTNNVARGIGVNVVNMTGSTKKISNTMAYTEYIITSTRAPFKSINTVLTLKGGKNFSSKVVPYKNSYAYSGGIYSNYTGKKKYFSCRLVTQYTTTWGPGSVSCSAGGLMLGK